MYRNLWGLVAIFAGGLAVALLIFGATSARNEPPADFTFVNGTEPKSLDPNVMTGQPEGRIGWAIFEGLTYHDPETLRPMPGVAESWTISEDGRTYTFKLRKEAKWSDGVPITAHDFTWSWRRLQDPKLGSEYPYIQHMIKYAEEFNTYGGHVKRLEGKIAEALGKLIKQTNDEGADGIDAKTWEAFVKANHVNDTVKGTPDAWLREVLVRREGRLSNDDLTRMQAALATEAKRRADVLQEANEKFGRSGGVFAKDDHTLVVELKAPTPYFLEITTFYSSCPVPRHVVEKKDADGNVIEGEYVEDWFTPGKIVSNGPFVLHEWRVNEKIRLHKSETYWGKDTIKVDIIDALPIENATTGMNLYLAGTVDWMPTPPPPLAGVLAERPEKDYYLRPGMIVYYYRLNCTRKGLTDPRVRLAIAMSIDRKSIVENILKQGQKEAYHVVPPGIPGYEPPPSAIKYDPEAARKLLADAGFAGGEGLGTLRLLFNTNESHKAIAEAVTDQLRRNLGIKVNAYNQEWQAYQANMLALDYDIARAGWIGDYLDPNTFLDMWITNGGNNQTGWSNATYDAILRYAADVELLFKEDIDGFLAGMQEQDRLRGLMQAMESAPDTPSRLKAGEKLRMHLFREAEAIMFGQEIPIIPIYYYVTSNLVHPYVKGWYADLETEAGGKVPNLQDIHPLRGIEIDRERKQRRAR